MTNRPSAIDAPVDGAGRRVLLVEDHVDSALSVARLLRALGYDVRVAFDGVEALRCAAEFRPEAAFIDLSLPVLDGLAVATRLRAMSETRETRLIAMTGWATDESASLARDAGFDQHLVKPLSIGTLTAALATARC
jgi:two-component system CheB/CheR fusion protein